MALVNDDNNSDIGDGFPIGMRVLLVDNDPPSLLRLERQLHSCQYQVTTSTDATTALKMLRENKFDLVISELHMPEIDGLELLKLMQPWMDDIPVILFSNDYDRNLVMEAATLGACYYLLKPIRIEVLRNIWQHVYRKMINSKKNEDQNGNSSTACLPQLEER